MNIDMKAHFVSGQLINASLGGAGWEVCAHRYLQPFVARSRGRTWKCLTQSHFHLQLALVSCGQRALQEAFYTIQVFFSCCLLVSVLPPHEKSCFISEFEWGSYLSVLQCLGSSIAAWMNLSEMLCLLNEAWSCMTKFFITMTGISNQISCASM